MKNLTLSIIILLTSWVNAQVLITDGTDSTPTSESDILLELRSIQKDKGLLLPRLALQSIISPSPLSNHVAGIVVYNIATSGNAANFVFPGLYYNNGVQWVRLNGKVKPEIGDIKHSAQNADHDGWYLLNGRNRTLLGTVASQNALNLGFTNAIPNMVNRYLKTNANGQASGTIGGVNSINITQANLPNINFTGQTATSGGHFHSYNDRANGTSNALEVNTVARVDNDNGTTRNTNTVANHTHTVTLNTGGENQAVNLTPQYMSAYVFVYLGE